MAPLMWLIRHELQISLRLVTSALIMIIMALAVGVR